LVLECIQQQELANVIVLGHGQQPQVQVLFEQLVLELRSELEQLEQGQVLQQLKQ